MKNIVVYNVGRIQLPVLPRPSSVGDAVVVGLCWRFVSPLLKCFADAGFVLAHAEVLRVR